VRKFASFAELALAFRHDIHAHLGLPWLEIDSSFLLVHKVLFNAFLTELLGKFCDLLKAFDVLFHLLDVSVLLNLIVLAIKVQVFDAFVDENVLAEGAVVERATLVDVEAHRC
jgi:hypothetical protein